MNVSDNFYFVMTWIVFTLCFVGMAGITALLWIYLTRSNKVQKKLDYFHELFEEHFKTTDQTILDTRKERDYWKKKAEKSS